MSLSPSWNVPNLTSCLLAVFHTPFSCCGEAGGITLFILFQIINAIQFCPFFNDFVWLLSLSWATQHQGTDHFPCFLGLALWLFLLLQDFCLPCHLIGFYFIDTLASLLVFLLLTLLPCHVAHCGMAVIRLIVVLQCLVSCVVIMFQFC